MTAWSAPRSSASAAIAAIWSWFWRVMTVLVATSKPAEVASLMLVTVSANDPTIPVNDSWMGAEGPCSEMSSPTHCGISVIKRTMRSGSSQRALVKSEKFSPRSLARRTMVSNSGCRVGSPPVSLSCSAWGAIRSRITLHSAAPRGGRTVWASRASAKMLEHPRQRLLQTGVISSEYMTGVERT